MNAQHTKTVPTFSFYPCSFSYYFNYGSYCPIQSYNNLKEKTGLSCQVHLTNSQNRKHSQELQTPSTPQDSQLRKENEDSSFNKIKKGAKTNRRLQSEDYEPYQRKKSKKVTSLKGQRNVLPIKIRKILSFLTMEKKSLEIIKKYIQKNSIQVQLNKKRFYAFLKMKKENIQNYVTLASLRNFLNPESKKFELYPVDEQLFYLKLVRVVFKYYLQNVCTLCSLTSTRIQRQQKIEHVKVRRDLMAFLFKGEDGSEVY